MQCSAKHFEWDADINKEDISGAHEGRRFR
jgi:hypothetical protein